MKPAGPLIALALLASIVTGREQAVQPESPRPAPLRTGEPAAAEHNLDLEKLVRLPEDHTISDLFASQSHALPAAPVARPPPRSVPAQVLEAAAAPTAPPLPFVYLGRMVRGGRTVAYLLKGEEMYLAEAGQMLGDDYRVEGITDAGVHFIFVPLGTKQVLNLPARQ